MTLYKVLWIEDNADNDLYHLTSPVYIDGRYHLDIAANASEAHVYLNKREYDIIIVDIRIPPGKDPLWLARYEELQNRRHTNSSRLGLELLRYIFTGENGRSGLKVPQNRAPERYGVFTVERHEELKAELEALNLIEVKYRRKNAMMPHTALLDFIEEVSGALENGLV